MHSFIITNRSYELQKQQALLFCQSKLIDSIDITLIDTINKTDEEGEGKKLQGIARIREVQKTLYLKPFKGEKKAIIILQAETLSHPAQNALLKTLEEPPSHTIVLLTTENTSLLLTTILSRCIHVQTEEKTTEKTYEPYLTNPVTPLSKAEALSKQKEDIAVFLEEEMLSLHKSLHDVKSDQITQLSKRLSLCLFSYKLIKTTNINPRFILENLFLSI